MFRKVGVLKNFATVKSLESLKSFPVIFAKKFKNTFLTEQFLVTALVSTLKSIECQDLLRTTRIRGNTLT